MKMQKIIMLAGVAGLLVACGGANKIVEPSDLNEQRAFFDFDSSVINEEARNNSNCW